MIPLYIRAWQPTFYKDPDDTLWFIGHTNEKMLSDECLDDHVELAWANGLELGDQDIADDFQNFLESRGYTAFYTAGPGTIYRAELGE